MPARAHLFKGKELSVHIHQQVGVVFHSHSGIMENFILRVK